jgi:lysosomal Pro-X carboxypeptidase
MFKTRAQEKDFVNRVREGLGSTGPQEYFFDAKIDHFTNHGANTTTYKMRYLVDATYFKNETGPIIFYAGNEGDIWTFFNNSGFMSTTLAQQFGAITVWAEHRYFGESMPFGAESFDAKAGNLKYLTTEAAQEDYIDLVKDFKQAYGLQDRAVIVGGGSYGGMLAAWLRMKYPNWF